MKITLKAGQYKVTVHFSEGADCKQHELDLIESPRLHALLQTVLNTCDETPSSRIFKKPEPVAAVWVQELLFDSGSNSGLLREQVEADINKELDRVGTNKDRIYRICSLLLDEGMDVLSTLHHDEKPSEIRKRLRVALDKVAHGLSHNIAIDNACEQIGPEMRANVLYLPTGRVDKIRLERNSKKKFSASNVVPDENLASYLRLLNISSDEYKMVLKNADRYSWSAEWEAFHVPYENKPPLLTAQDAVKLLDKADEEGGCFVALGFRASVREMAEVKWQKLNGVTIDC